MDIGQLWVTLGVNLAGLNAAYAAFGKLEGVAEASLGKVTAASEAAARAQTAAAISSSNAQIALDNKLMIQRIKAVERRVASEKAAEDTIIANRIKADLLFDKLAAQEMVRQQKVMISQIVASQKALAAQTAASANASAMMASNVNRLSLAFTRFGQSMTMYVTAPLLLIGYGAIKAVTTLDTLEHKIVSLTSTSQEQMNAWKPAIKAISDETHRSSAEITESFYFVANSALSAATTLKIVELASKASAIGMGSASDVGKALTFIYNAYGESAFNAAKTMDVLTVAIREGVVEINQIVPVIGPILPFAAKLGVSIDQVTSALAIMTRTGFNAARASTSIRAMLQGIADPAPHAEAALKSMGSSFAKLREIIRDKGLAAALAELNGIFIKMGVTASGKIFGNIRGEIAALGLTGPQMKALQEVAGKSKDESDAFARAWEISKISIQYSLDGIKVAFQNVLLSIGGTGGGLIRFFNDLAGKLNELANWFKNLTPAMQQHYIHMALWAAAIGPLVLFIGNLIRILGGLAMAVVWATTPWPKLILFITNFKRVLIFNATAISAQWMSMLGVIGITNPWVGAAIAIALVTAAIVLYLRANREATQAQKAVLDINTQVATSTIREKNQIDQLLRIVQSHNTTLAQKEDAIKKLNAISPEYLGGITQDAINTGTATEAINKYIKALQDKAKAQAIQEKMVETEKQYISDVMSGADKQLSFIEKFTVGSKIRQSIENANAAKSKKNYTETMISLQAMYDVLMNVTKATKELSKADNTPGFAYLDPKTLWSWESANELSRGWNKTLDDIKTNIKDIMSLKIPAYVIPGMPTSLSAVPPPGETEAQKLARLKAAEESQKSNEESIKKRQEFIKSFNESYDAIITKANVLGNTILENGKKFDAADEKNKLFFTTFENGGKIMKQNDPFMQAMIANLYMYGGALDYTFSVLKDMSEQLSVNTANVKVSGDSLGGMTSQLSIFSEALKKLSVPGSEGGKAVLDLKQAISELNDEISRKTLQKALAETAMGSAFLGGSFDKLGAKIQAHKNRIADLKKAYNLATEAGDATTMMQALLGAQAENSTINFLGLNDITKKYNDSVADLLLKENQAGISFKVTGDLIKLDEDYIEQLSIKYREAAGDTKALAVIQGLLNDAYSKLSTDSAMKSIKDYEEAIKNIKDRKGWKGSGVSDWIQIKKTAEEAIKTQQKLRASMSVLSPEYEKASAAILKYGNDVKKANAMINFDNIMEGISDGLSTIVPVMGAYVSLLDAQQNRALKMVETVAKARNKSEAWVTAQNLKINEEYAKKKKRMAIAEAIVNTAISVTKAMSQLGWFSFIEIPMLLAAGALQIAAINAQPMAQGGVVPTGYKNDTYPAMLSSGEVVVPPHKLASIQNGNNSQRMFKPVVLRAEGRDLVGVLEEMGTLNNSY